MMNKLLYALCITICLFCSVSYAAKSDYHGELPIIIKNLPRFEDYTAASKSVDKISPVDLSSHPEAKKFKTVLTEGVAQAKRPNFAGNYIIVQNGCGSPCAMNWIIDARNGRIVDMFSTPGGDVMYHRDSSLIIANIHSDSIADQTDNIPYIISSPDDVGAASIIDFYILKDNKIHKIMEINPIGLFPYFEDKTN